MLKNENEYGSTRRVRRLSIRSGRPAAPSLMSAGGTDGRRRPHGVLVSLVSSTLMTGTSPCGFSTGIQIWAHSPVAAGGGTAVAVFAAAGAWPAGASRLGLTAGLAVAEARTAGDHEGLAGADLPRIGDVIGDEEILGSHVVFLGDGADRLAGFDLVGQGAFRRL